MRIRSIKPDFFHDDRLCELPALARILFAGLWCMADGKGRLEDRPKRIKADVLPYDDCDVDDLLQQLDRGGFIQRYDSEHGPAIQVTNFSKHQRISGREATEESGFSPPPPRGSSREASTASTGSSREASTASTGSSREASTASTGSSREASTASTGSSREAAVALEGKGREGKGKDLPADAVAPQAQDHALDQGQDLPLSGGDPGPTNPPPAARPRKVPDTRHAQTIALWCQLWTELRGGTYQVAGAKDWAAVSRLLKIPDATDVEINRRIRFALQDAWFRQHGDLAGFVSKWSTWQPAKPDPPRGRTGAEAYQDKHGPGGTLSPEATRALFTGGKP